MAQKDGCPMTTIKFPATRSQVEVAGYAWQFSRPCKRCGKHLEFYRTPAGRLAPLEMTITNGNWLFISHFSTCPYAHEFRKPAGEGPEKKQRDLFAGEIKKSIGEGSEKKR